MEETKTEDHQLERRKNWVKFEDERSPSDGASAENGVQPASTGESASVAVLPVDSGHQVTTPPHNSDTLAVIDTTQVHISLDKNQRPISTRTTSHPHPTPAPRTVPPSAVQRSISIPNAGVASLPVAPTPSVRSEIVGQVGIRANSRGPPRPPGPQRLQTIPLRDIVNGSSAARSVSIRQDSFTLRQGFANGDVIVSLFPVNEKCSWLTRATFRPELVPEELMAEGLTLTVEEYVAALELLVNDVRFNVYNICYKRILLFWILFGFIVLLGLLFSGQRGLGLFGGGVVWLFLNATGIFVCMWLKMRMNRYLERCLASVNKYLWKHKILLGLDDKGKLSCHKVNLIFVYFDCNDCVRRLNEFIDVYNDNNDNNEQERRTQPSVRSRMDIDDSDIIITGTSNQRVSRKQERAEKLLLRYSQRWVKEYTRHRLDLSVDVHDRAEGEPPAAPRHCVHARCPCQFIEEHLKYKPRGKFCGCQLFNF